MVTCASPLFEPHDAFGCKPFFFCLLKETVKKCKLGCAANWSGRKSDSSKMAKCNAACTDLGDKLSNESDLSFALQRILWRLVGEGIYSHNIVLFLAKAVPLRAMKLSGVAFHWSVSPLCVHKSRHKIYIYWQVFKVSCSEICVCHSASRQSVSLIVFIEESSLSRNI